MTRIEQLEREAELAMARLGVSEEFGWIVGFCVGIICELRWHIGWWQIPVYILVYFVVTYPYRRKETASSDAYNQELKIVNHFRQSKSNY